MYRLAKEKGIESIGYYIGGMKEAKLKESEKCRLLLGTYPMASTGLDIPTLNAMVLASPKSDIIQSIGRIDRKKHENIQPIIIDCVDQFSLFENQARKRLDVYRKKGYEVTDTHIQIDKTDFPILHEKKYQFHLKKRKDSDDECEGVEDSDEEDGKTQTKISCFFDEMPSETKTTEVKKDGKIGKRPPPSKVHKDSVPKKVNEKEMAQKALMDPKAFLFS
jgi:HSP90 family molecular chaperone